MLRLAGICQDEPRAWRPMLAEMGRARAGPTTYWPEQVRRAHEHGRWAG